MIATILTIIAYLLPLIMEGIKAAKEKNKGNNHDANVQEFRKKLEGRSQGSPLQSNDIDAALADQYDRVQSALRGSERLGEGNYHEGVAG